MRPAAYSFIRYEITDQYDEPITSSQHGDILKLVDQVEVPHRKRDPQKSDFDTFVFNPESKKVKAEPVVAFNIGKRITSRIEHRLKNGQIEMVSVPADDIHWSRVVMVPRLSIAAVRDGSGDRLAARSAISRVRSVFRHALNYEFLSEQTGNPQDVDRALSRLGLTDFAFTVVPFNPHPRVPGDRLDELLQESNVGRLRADAKPKPGGLMNSEGDGILKEVRGLSEAGYGQFGFKGLTKEAGSEVTYKKPKFESTKEENIERRRRPTEMRASIPSGDEKHSEEEQVVMTILELYDG